MLMVEGREFVALPQYRAILLSTRTALGMAIHKDKQQQFHLLHPSSIISRIQAENLHISGARTVLKKLRRNCPRCGILAKKNSE